ncbi:hypothetical protein EDD21DRAFT_300151 [Dissophora ornata]|nr:hypothetical protein EDD21DRAFT_300151 [Dissophora ornata]
MSSRETTLHETLRLDSAKPSDPIDANEIVQQLLPGANSLQSRLRTLDELSKIIQNYPFQHISELWVAVEDLLEAGVPHNARKAAWHFMVACIKGQFEDLGMLRAIFYQAINNHEIWEDFDDKLQALKELTKDGRDVYGFEKNIVRMLAHWIESSFDQAKSTTSLATLSSTPQLILLQKPIPHFDTTMALLINVVRFNFVFFEELEIANLLDLLHTICINAPEDTPHAIVFLDVIVRYGYVPTEGLSTFLKILCLTTVSDLYMDQAWTITNNLMKSHSKHSAIRLLCLNLRLKDESSLSVNQTRVVQGSIRLLQRSVWSSNPIDTLSVSYSTILWSLKSAVEFKSREIDLDIIRSLSVLLQTHHANVGDLEYEIILDILERLSGLVNEKPTGDISTVKPFVFRLGSNSAATTQQQPQSPLRDAYGGLLFHFISLYNDKRITGIAPRLMGLLASLQDHLPEDTMLLLLEYYYSEHQFYPYTPNWLERLHNLVQVSVIRDKRPKVRSKALLVALDVYESSLEFFQEEITTIVFMDVFDSLESETDRALASQVSTLLINATRIASDDLFTRLLDRIVNCIRCTCLIPKPHHLAQPPGPPIACQSLSAAIGIIDLFQHALYDPNGASRVDTFFSLLVGLAVNQSIHKASRLVLLDFLLCLRVDLDHRIFCSSASTIESMTAATEQLLSEETRQDKGGDRPGRTMQASPYVISYLEIASTTSDTLSDETLPAPMVGCAKVILNIPLYMTGVLSILEQERDFEIYSFVIQRLPSQLFNKHLFCNSSEQITRLHSVLVDMTLRDKIPDSLRNLPLSAKRHNIHILAYKVLVILLCYHSKFSTNESHDLVQAFVAGLLRQATCAKICIHALVVCCYELPQSMTKHLSGTVLKLSQIMSTATISVHILEFLSTVARLPMLYSNFVGDDYRRVFGIALKYIQYTHSVAGNAHITPSPSTPSSAVSSPMSPSGAPQAQTSAGARALPQYVLIMAYQVIDVWFMLQRLPERRKYVPYIIRNLLMANEPGKKVDEQTETCLDMLSRYSYANCEPKPKVSLIQQILVGSTNKTGKVVTKTWLLGTSFITVRTAHNVGWAEITTRRASGTASFLLKIENEMFLHSSEELDFSTLPGLLRLQEEAFPIDAVAQQSTGISGISGDNTIDSEQPSEPSQEAESRREEQHLAAVSGFSADGGKSFAKTKMETFVDPSFLFMQLTSYPDLMARETPVLLADDDATNRALGVLDRTPVVDFHKVGVLYVGKGQTKESEILGNTHGSSEYTKFLTGLGSLVRLKNAKIYAGGLDLEMDLDGEYAYSHQDEITQMVFHVATMMPNHAHDVNFDFKKRHIGNDWVTIVFNESGQDYDFGTISGQFNFMTLVVTPVSMAATAAPTAATATTTGSVQPFKNVWFKVLMLRRPDMPEIGPLATPKIISASELARFTRQMALHANIYAQVYFQHLQNSVEYVSNWQERLRQIKRVKERVQSSGAGAGGSGAGAGSGVGGANTTTATGAGAGGATGGSSSSGVGNVGNRGGVGSNLGAPGSSGNYSSVVGGGNQGGGNGGSSIGLGLGLGLGLGSSSSSSTSAFGTANTSGAGGGSGGAASQGQQGSIMSLEPFVDFTRYA